MSNLKWLWLHVVRAKWLLMLSVVLLGLEAYFNLSAIRLQQSMLDEVMIGGQSDRFWPVLLQIAFAYAAYSLLFTFGPHVMHLTLARVRTSMSSELMERMYQMPIRKLQSERTANYVYHFSNDLETSAHLAASDTPRLVQQLVSASMIVMVIAQASFILLAIMLGIVILYIMLGKKFSTARKKAASEIKSNQSSLLIHLEEGVSSTREVIAFHRQDWEHKLYRQKFQRVYDSIMKEGKLINKQLLLSDPLKWGCTLFVLFYCGTEVMKGNLSIGLFIVTFQFANRFMDSIGGIYQFVMGISAKIAAVERVRGVLEGEKLEDGVQTLDGPIQSIHFEKVSFSYDRQLVLDQLDLSIPTGQKTAFVGSSGGGKSTIASLLVRFFDPSEGIIYINGKPLRDIRRADWMSRVTLVFQEPYLLPDTIRTNILFGAEDVSEEAMIEVCRAMRIDDFIMSLPEGYDTIIGERGVTLSGGQRQRLALARAVLRNTEVLILDEATSSLDMETERQVQESLDLLRKGQITLVIAHRLSTIENSELIVVMDRGTVAEQGKHTELLHNDSVYRSLVHREKEEQEDVVPLVRTQLLIK